MQSSNLHPAVRQLQLGQHQHGATYPESRVLIVVTGGTICMMPSEHGLVPAHGFLKTGLAPSATFNDGSYPDPLEIVARDNSGTRLSLKSPPFTKPVQSLRTPPSRYSRQVRYCVYEFDNLLDSSNIDGHGWDTIAQSISDNYGRFDGFVVLHGTDSLAYSASALSFMLQNLGKPVILSGSQAPIWQLQTDATDNLLGSLVIAGHFMIPEVCLFFNKQLFRGNRSTKVSADSFAAFASPNLAPLATVTGMSTMVNWDLVCRPAASPFTIRSGIDTSCVACIRAFPGIQPAMVDSILRTPGLRGLVMESFGAGNIPDGNGETDGKSSPTLSQILADAVKRGIIVVNVSQCLTGSVLPLYAAGMALHRAGVVLGKDMTTEAALTKLAYLLTFSPGASNHSDSDVTLDEQAVAQRMGMSLRGELSELDATRFVHPLVGETMTEESITTSSGAIGREPSPVSNLRPQSNTGDHAWPPPVSPASLAIGGSKHASGILTPDQAALATLSYAIKAIDLHLVADTLARHSHPRRLLSEADYAGNTPLHIAAGVLSDHSAQQDSRQSLTLESENECKRSHLPTPPLPSSILSFLLSYGASVHVRNCAGHTPLFVAARAGNIEFVSLLLAAGAHLHPAEMVASRASALAAIAIKREQEKHLEQLGEDNNKEGLNEETVKDDGDVIAAMAAIEGADRLLRAWGAAGVKLGDGASLII